MKQQESYIFQGMQRDLSVSKHPVQFLYDAKNIRLTAREGDTLLSITNERGTLDTNIDINGTYLGHCQLNEFLVIFSTTSTDRDPDTGITTGLDYITRINLKDGNVAELYDSSGNKGNLGFCTLNPIEAISSYENLNIQKVYWTDGFNQPRFINIVEENPEYNSKSFDFVQELALREEVRVDKILGANGEFPPGVIQYAFTYYKKYGQETNIFYTTPLQYITYKDRAGAPDGKIQNAFRITVKNPDRNFDYLRIYSILRTSLNAVPIVKRVQDILVSKEEGEDSISYIDTNYSGESVDPTQLLYLGGEEIAAQTIGQKDGTLFLGNITIKRSPIPDSVKSDILSKNGVTKDHPVIKHTNNNVEAIVQDRPFMLANKPPFAYTNTLVGPGTAEEYQGAACFKSREYYRLGVQFQYKNGKWSEPCWIGDRMCDALPRMDESGASITNSVLGLPEFRYTIQGTLLQQLYSLGYRKVRGLFVQPGTQDRTIICQGVGAPTVYRDADNFYQSSWLFRTKDNTVSEEEDCLADGFGGKVSWRSEENEEDVFLRSQYNKDVLVVDPTVESTNYTLSPYLTCTEVMGIYDESHSFKVNPFLCTLHSPDVEFDESMANMDFKGCSLRCVGYVQLDNTYGDIDIQTVTPAIGSNAAGFIHESIETNGFGALISGSFYNDHIVDDVASGDTIRYESYHTDKPPVRWPVYMWHKNGSLNNDISRNNRSAELLKKKISNYRRGGITTYDDSVAQQYVTPDIQLFNSDVLQMIKVNGKIYLGNVETMLTPTTPSPYYIVGNPFGGGSEGMDLGSRSEYKLRLEDPNNTDSKNGVWQWYFYRDPGSTDFRWDWWYFTHSGQGDDVGDKVPGLDQWREGVVMKYKSTPHLVCELSDDDDYEITQAGGILHGMQAGQLPLIEVYKGYNKNTIFGGTSDDALQAAVWIPCGPPVAFDDSGSDKIVLFKWGDTYFQRFECLKTYPFTPEDKNQVVEIASFMCETRVNADGRYDRNRGQKNNLNMTPQNFNLWNPVYSQMDNFFTYKILDSDFYRINHFPNQITWSKEKQAGAETDLWTNVTLASTYDMDGSKGVITSLNTWKDQIFCFQNKGVSNILFNSRVQIPASDGVPIEITNNYKVDGYRYISDGIGCNDKFLIKETPSGIYFIDSIGDHLIHISEGLLDLSEQCNMTKWFKDYADAVNKVVYDDINHDIYLIRPYHDALCFSEKLNQFTGFYDYKGIHLIETYDGHVFTLKNRDLWKMFEGNYGNFFGSPGSWYLTFISNGAGSNLIGADKIFTNLEFRACVEDEGTLHTETGQFTPSLPLTSIEVWDEYQHGYSSLNNANGHISMLHHTPGMSSTLKRKFRIWRCDIPRNNCLLDEDQSGLEPYSSDLELGIARKICKPLDRMRNPWLYVKLQQNALSPRSSKRVEIHDLLMTYYS